jgi:tetratricopeptide (TPR) repeat protein
MVIRNPFKGLVFFMLVFWPGIAFTQSLPTETQKFKSQADDLEDKSAQAIDDGDMDQGLGFMVRSIQLDPTPMRHLIYGSILFGDGVSVFKDSDQQKGIVILRQAEAQLNKAIDGFSPNKDQMYLGQCYFLLGEMYLNAFGDRPKARDYFQKSVDLNDYPGAKDELNKLSS